MDDSPRQLYTPEGPIEILPIWQYLLEREEEVKSGSASWE